MCVCVSVCVYMGVCLRSILTRFSISYSFVYFRNQKAEAKWKIMQTPSYRQHEAANRAIQLKVLRMLEESDTCDIIDVNLELKSPLKGVNVHNF